MHEHEHTHEMASHTNGGTIAEEAQAAGFDMAPSGVAVTAWPHCHCMAGGLFGHPIHADVTSDEGESVP